MSGRSRGRQNPNQDADEERRLWKEIDDKAKGVDALVSRSNEIGEEIVQVELQQAEHLNNNKLSDASLDERLEKLYRENVKLSEEVNHIIEGKSNEMNLLDSINILAGLREASEESAAQHLSASHSTTSRNGKLSRGGPNKKGAASNLKSSAVSTPAAIAASTEPERTSPSAAPSPRIIIGGPGRLSASKEKPSRSGSIATTTREASVKIEDGAESVASSTDTPASSKNLSISSSAAAANNARGAHRLVLKLGEIVFCRHLDAKDPTLEGEGILCRVTNVIGEGKQRRYEVQDADTSGEAPPPQRASVAQLIVIPHTNVGLGDLPKGRSVIAQYPDTTTFYKAEVNEGWRARDCESKGEFSVKLNFQEDEEAREVERRFVLSDR